MRFLLAFLSFGIGALAVPVKDRGLPGIKGDYTTFAFTSFYLQVSGLTGSNPDPMEFNNKFLAVSKTCGQGPMGNTSNCAPTFVPATDLASAFSVDPDTGNLFTSTGTRYTAEQQNMTSDSPIFFASSSYLVYEQPATLVCEISGTDTYSLSCNGGLGAFGIGTDSQLYYLNEARGDNVTTVKRTPSIHKKRQQQTGAITLIVIPIVAVAPTSPSSSSSLVPTSSSSALATSSAFPTSLATFSLSILSVPTVSSSLSIPILPSTVAPLSIVPAISSSSISGATPLVTASTSSAPLSAQTICPGSTSFKLRAVDRANQSSFGYVSVGTNCIPGEDSPDVCLASFTNSTSNATNFFLNGTSHINAQMANYSADPVHNRYIVNVPQMSASSPLEFVATTYNNTPPASVEQPICYVTSTNQIICHDSEVADFEFSSVQGGILYMTYSTDAGDIALDLFVRCPVNTTASSSTASSTATASSSSSVASATSAAAAPTGTGPAASASGSPSTPANGGSQPMQPAVSGSGSSPASGNSEPAVPSGTVYDPSGSCYRPMKRDLQLVQG